MPRKAAATKMSAGSQFFESILQFADFALQFGQTVEDGLCFEPLAIFHCGVARVERGRRDVIGDSAFCRDHGTVADREVPGRSDLAGENAPVTYFCGTG